MYVTWYTMRDYIHCDIHHKTHVRRVLCVQYRMQCYGEKSSFQKNLCATIYQSDEEDPWRVGENGNRWSTEQKTFIGQVLQTLIGHTRMLQFFPWGKLTEEFPWNIGISLVVMFIITKKCLRIVFYLVK